MFVEQSSLHEASTDGAEGGLCDSNPPQTEPCPPGGDSEVALNDPGVLQDGPGSPQENPALAPGEEQVWVDTEYLSLYSFANLPLEYSRRSVHSGR